MDATAKILELAKGLKAWAEKFNQTPDTQKFNEAKASDGTILQYEGETPTAGLPVNVIDEAGQVLPAPTGDYTLEDGSVLKVQDVVIM